MSAGYFGASVRRGGASLFGHEDNCISYLFIIFIFYIYCIYCIIISYSLYRILLYRVPNIFYETMDSCELSHSIINPFR